MLERVGGVGRLIDAAKRCSEEVPGISESVVCFRLERRVDLQVMQQVALL